MLAMEVATGAQAVAAQRAQERVHDVARERALMEAALDKETAALRARMKAKKEEAPRAAGGAVVAPPLPQRQRGRREPPQRCWRRRQPSWRQRRR